MAGSGLCEALQSCYGSVTVSHMISGKAVTRATRGHFLIESALYILLLDEILSGNFDSNDSHNKISSADCMEIENEYQNVVNG